MLRFLSFPLLWAVVCSQSPSTVGILNPTLPPIVPAIPTVFPFAANRNVVPGYNNPYYNPERTGAAIPILTYTNDHAPDGTYSFSFSTADGKHAQESGYLKDAFIDNNGEPQGTQVVQGSYSYVAPDGTPIQVNYIADENGFRPTGVHIPADGKGLPLPPVIAAKDGKVIDPSIINRYDPFNRSPLNYYKNGIRPFDTRHPYNSRNPYDPKLPYDPKYPLPYDPARYNRYNPAIYNPALGFNNPTIEPKKESA